MSYIRGKAYWLGVGLVIRLPLFGWYYGDGEYRVWWQQVPAAGWCVLSDLGNTVLLSGTADLTLLNILNYQVSRLKAK